MATKQEISTSVLRLTKAFSGFKPDPEALKGFMEIVVEKLTPFPAFIIQRAVEKIIETSQYFPRISEMLCACYQERDNDMAELNNTLQSYKDDWYVDKIHSAEEWKALENGYLKLGSKTSAAYAVSVYEKYGTPAKRPTPEQIAKGKKQINKVLESMEVK